MSCEFNSKSNYFEKPEALTRLRPQKPAYFQKRQNEQNKEKSSNFGYFQLSTKLFTKPNSKSNFFMGLDRFSETRHPFPHNNFLNPWTALRQNDRKEILSICTQDESLPGPLERAMGQTLIFV